MIDPILLDIGGHIFYLSIALGMYCLSKKDIDGWIFRLIGEAGWVSIGLILGMSSIWIWGLIFMGIDLKGYLEWKKRKPE